MRVFGAPMFLLWTMTFSITSSFWLVAARRGAGKSEFVKQPLSLKRYIMTNPPERIVWFYGRCQPDLFCCLAQEIPSMEFYEGLPTDIELMFDRSKRNICIIDDLMQSASGNQLVENLFTFDSVCRFSQSKLILYGKEMQNHLFEFNLHRGFQESTRSIPNSSSSMSDVPIQAKILTSSMRRRNERFLWVFILRFSSQFTKICKSSWKYFPI